VSPLDISQTLWARTALVKPRLCNCATGSSHWRQLSCQQRAVCPGPASKHLRLVSQRSPARYLHSTVVAMEHSGPLLAFTCRAWVTIFLLGKSVDVLTRRRFSRWLSQHHITWALGVFIYQHAFAAPNPDRAILQPAIATGAPALCVPGIA
jgi:hypothetical protein